MSYTDTLAEAAGASNTTEPAGLLTTQEVLDELARKVEALERKAIAHDQDLQAVFKALKELIAPPQPARREIGFHARPMESAPASGMRRTSLETAARPARRPTRQSTH